MKRFLSKISSFACHISKAFIRKFFPSVSIKKTWGGFVVKTPDIVTVIPMKKDVTIKAVVEDGVFLISCGGETYAFNRLIADEQSILLNSFYKEFRPLTSKIKSNLTWIVLLVLFVIYLLPSHNAIDPSAIATISQEEMEKITKQAEADFSNGIYGQSPQIHQTEPSGETDSAPVPFQD